MLLSSADFFSKLTYPTLSIVSNVWFGTGHCLVLKFYWCQVLSNFSFSLVDFPMQVARISMDLPILYFKGSQIEILKLCGSLSESSPFARYAE